ncbi:chromosomal replication initiator DnaA [Acuticoccus sediminis]|uniref:Chromosomal replication initiator DnaA n=1 Tax=Acuticoccus sediminis TaxID=2184697 RepID=A0A8B2NSQ4_9HYPH|nr:chromosomal replication initiator DnaA [Acuticoccus sediminis]RAI00484.1 chromosomal replication initiator DnaA [Acuticoccus sediminis]
MEQLALDLNNGEVPPATIVTPCNAAAFALVDEWPRWSHPVALVRGGEGTGKSHLARAFAERTGAAHLAGEALRAGDVLQLARGPVVVDDADRADERALFHLINAVRAAGTTLLLTARSRAGIALPDLASRLNATPETVLQPPDDILLRRVLVEAFLARQLPADPAVVTFLMARVERTLHAAVQMVERIDKAGLAEQRGPTRPLAARVLKTGGSIPDDIVP